MVGHHESVAHNRSEALMARWDESFPARQPLGRELLNRYRGVTRVYHNLTHLWDILQAVDLLADEADDRRMVDLAAWFHDAVYDVRRSDNEELSARLAEATLPAYDFDDGEVTETARLVRLTATHGTQPGDANGAVLCDADLSVLGESAEGYDEYVHRVRAEYRHVRERDFRVGRAELLQQLLDLPVLFRTRKGSALWEKQARLNIERELELLRS